MHGIEINATPALFDPDIGAFFRYKPIRWNLNIKAITGTHYLNLGST